MYEVDIEQFWKDDELAHKENCFSKEAPQVALGIAMSDECVFAELGEEGDPWGYTPRERRLELNKRYNDKAEKIVGKRLLREDYPKDDEKAPNFKGMGEVFEGKYIYNPNSGTTYLEGSVSTEQELEALLDRVDKLDLYDFVLPDNWASEKKRVFELTGKKPGLCRHVRGPVTLATSIFGVENLLFLYYDSPELYKRFSDTILKVLMAYIDISNKEADYILGSKPDGFSFADDDCNLLTPEMYSVFGYQILKAVFDKVAPNEYDRRYQHSDSAMAHLLPQLGTLNLTNCNFGPTLSVREIRHYCPKTKIDGQLAPFTFMRNNPEDIIAEVKRDCEQAKENDLRGLNEYTAGSINNGSSLESMRIVMHAIQKYGRY